LRLVRHLQVEYNPRFIPEKAIKNMAKLFVVLEKWIRENDIKALSIQCWTILERKLGITPCTVMSMLSESMIPAACEVDVMGALSMYTLQVASGKPSALVDWNNNYGEDEVILFHCGNFPKSMYESVEMSIADVISNSVGKQNAYGACAGKIKAGPFTFFRLTSDDVNGFLKAYVGEGEILRENPKTFGSRGIARIKGLEQLMNYVCNEGFEHHVAINLSKVANVICEAMKYLKIPVHRHS
ncbi:MAG: fucose isomerase, partial [Pseudothermotoga sp.]